ncbi:3',5'-cyclic-nucleotide phosphodiesterase [Lunasporangiospora selenospora]|uniref:Phosphodiesterase n=1 Tax=Lunasporangiospora selenospora TaxID=979761 RepID=A0A9P6FS11_9FUNG|nr:3',5'-cyclic-nucleotide phosphodiesterase [Lunasporangiospora selenospora]
MLLLVDVDTDLEISAPFPSGGVRSRPHSRNASYRGGNVRDAVSADTTVVSTATHKSHHGNNRQHNTSALRAPSDGAVTKGSSQRAHNRTQQKSPKQNGLSEHLTGLEFLEGVLQGLAKGTLHHIVPVAMSSTTSQDKVLELFNLGVADVLLKPIEEQVVRTLFLNVHRYGKYRTAITIPRYNTQKNNLSFPSHARLRSVFLKDQWLSDILVSHYCPTPTKISIHDFPSMSSYAAMERVVELKRRLLSWDFHPHDLCQDDLMRCVVVVIQEVMKLDGLGDLNIPDHLLHRFVIGLRDSYHRSNPYHNFAHAVDVLQATFYFLCRMGLLPETGCGYPPISGSDNNRTTAKSETNVEMGGVESKANIPNGGEASTAAARPTEDSCPLPQIRVQDFLRPEDIFALIVASIGHDVGHPGVNNMFLVNAHTPLAQVYNDRSVLESFHSMALFQVMKKHGFECFDVDSQNRKFMEFRKMVVSTILATDMGLHFDYVTKIKEQTERIRLRNFHKEAIPVAKQASIDEQERLVLCGTLIKCADISNAADIEKEMANCSGNQPVPAGPTKDLASDPGMQIDTQLGFIHGFAMPLFASVKDIIPEMGYCVDMLHINHQIWKDRKAEFIKTGTGAPLSAVLAQPMLSNQNRLKSVEEPERATGSSSSRPSTPSRKSNSSGQSHLRTKAHSGKNSNHSTGGRGHAGASGHDEKESLNSSIVSPKAGEAAGNARNHQRSTSGIVPPSSRPHSISGSNHSNNYNSQARHAANSNLNANTSSGSAPSESSSVNGNAASSGLPRPRLRAKALTSEGNPIPVPIQTAKRILRSKESDSVLKQQSGDPFDIAC